LPPILPPSPSAAPPALHSFPTRRSSDLGGEQTDGRGRVGNTLTAGGLADRPPGHDNGLALRGGRFAVPVVPAVDRYFPVSTSARSEEHTSELQSRENLVCRLLLEKKKKT